MSERDYLLTVELPLSVQVSKNRKFILNLNVYRNAHHRVLAVAKRLYHDEVCKLLAHQPPIPTPVRLEWTYYAPTRRRVDVDNPLSIVTKFTCDALVELGILPDDDYQHVLGSDTHWGGVDKDNPRVVLRVYPCKS